MAGSLASALMVSPSSQPKVLTTAGHVYGWGANTYGQLGIHAAHDQLDPLHMRDLNRRQITQLVAGAAHTVALTADGRVVVFGSNAFGQLGLKLAPGRQWEPVRLDLSDGAAPARLVAAGPYQTMILSRDGTVLMAGRSFFDTRPIPTDAKTIRRQRTTGPFPCLLQLTEVPLSLDISQASVLQLAVGLTHALALLDDGGVASVGMGAHGVLGHGETRDCAQFRRVQALRDRTVDAVAVGEAFSVAQDVQGQVWVWGCDDAGELGMQGGAADRCTPIALSGLGPTQRAFSAASNHSGAKKKRSGRRDTDKNER